MTKNTVVHGRFIDSLSAHFRRERSKLLKTLILRLKDKTSLPLKIIDFGGTYNYWENIGFDFLVQNDIGVTCVNISNPEIISSTDTGAKLKFIEGSVCDLSGFADNSFDLVHSNSVIEHVGRWSEMCAFAREARRLAPAYYVQTPYFWFPIDPHYPTMPFFHWMPITLRAKLMQTFRIGRWPANRNLHKVMAILEDSILLDGAQFRTLFPDATITAERLAALPKSLIAIRQ